MLKKLEPTSIEAYLQQIARELRDLPASARADELREIEAHLRAMVEAHQNADVDEAQATAQTLKQFGRPHKVGREMRKAWERKQPEAWWRAVVAPAAGLSFFALDALIYTMVYDLINACFNNILKYPWSAQMYLCAALWMLAAMFIMGFVVGIVSPKRSIWLILAYSLYSLYALSMLASAPQQAEAMGLSVRFVVYISLLTNFLCPLAALAGNHFGAQRGRKGSVRLENAGKRVFAHIAQGRKFLARIAGDSKLNAQL